MEVDIDLLTDKNKAGDNINSVHDELVEDIIEASESSLSNPGLGVLHESQEYHPTVTSKLHHSKAHKRTNT